MVQLSDRDAATAEIAIGSLADVLRSSVSTDAETVPLADELATVMDHLQLHQLLLPAPDEISFSVAPEVWAAEVPAMILQSLVTNSLAAQIEDGSLEIAVYQFRSRTSLHLRLHK